MASAAKRLTYLAAAAEDVRRLYLQDRRPGQLVIQRLTDLAAGRLQGQPLGGELSDCRKVYVGIRGNQPTHRIVYRELRDGTTEIIEVIAVGEREALLVYREAVERLRRL